MGKPVKFIHGADIHLGSPLKTIAEFSNLKQKLETANYSALKRLVNAAIEQQVDFVLFSGDIFDQEIRSVSANQFLSEQMGRLAAKEIPVFIIHGNHDPLDQAKEYVRLPDNVTIFGHEEPEMAEILGDDGRPLARVLGQSYRNASESRKMYHGFGPPDDDVLNIGMLHTALNPAENKYVPCSLEELKSKQSIDYWALGHVHSPVIHHWEKPFVAFPGILQGRDVGETGLGGCFMVEAEKGGRPTISFIPTASIIWLKCKVSINDAVEIANLDDLTDFLLQKGQELLDHGPGLRDDIPIADSYQPHIDGYVVRWEIVGRGKIHSDVLAGNEEEAALAVEDKLRQSLGKGQPFIWTEKVKINTEMNIPDLQDLLREDEVFRALNDIYTSMLLEKDSKEILNSLGNVWSPISDHEEARDDALKLDEDKCVELIERARNMVIERIIQGREQHENS